MPALSGRLGCWAYLRPKIDFNPDVEAAPQPDLRHGALKDED